MSRIELDAIQNKLKTAIQNHQILVKTKGDQQNVAFKTCLKELQEEIKRLSEEQKKIVVKLRESLVKSSSQPQPVSQQQPNTTAVTNVVGGELPTVLNPQTVTAAIGQSRLMYPSQGGTAILPVGMVAVPLAHVQRPTLGVTFNAGRGQICTPTGSITLQPGDYANAVVAAAAAAAQLPSGLHAGNNITIPINNSVNNNSTNIALQNSIAINNITNAINVSSLNGNIVNGSINITGLNSANTPTINNLNTIIGSAGLSAHPLGNIVIGSKALTQLNNNNNIALTTVVNSQGAANMVTTQNGNTTKLQSNTLASGVSITSADQIIKLSNGSNPQPPIAVSSSQTLSSSGTSCITVASNLSTIPTVAKDQLAILQSQIPQQPQQQQTVQIPQVFQQQQRLIATSANFPIKVPHFTASPTRTTYCSIALAPGPSLPTPLTRQPVPSTVALTSASVKKPEATTKPSVSKISTLPVPNVSTFANKGKTTTAVAVKAESTTNPETQPPPVNPLMVEEDRKHQFMKALDLYAPEMLRDLLHKRNERKRRTTANPHYSIGFQSHRWQRNEILTDAYPFKKAKVGKERKPIPKPSQSDSQSKKDKMSDSHDDFCAACGKGGPLLMCETCRLVYHLDCLKPPLTEAPKYAWSCPKCLVSGKGAANLSSEALCKVHSYIGKRIAKEDERKKQQRKGAEIRNEKSFLDNRAKKLETEIKDHNDSKRKLDEKEKLSKKELDQLSVLVQSVRENHSTINCPVSKASSKLTSVSSTPNILPLSSLNTSSSISVKEPPCQDSVDSVKEENNLNLNDSPQVTVVEDDRIVLEFKVSAQEFSEIENNSSKSCVPMETDELITKSDCKELEQSVVSDSSISQDNSSNPTPPEPSAPTVMNSCGESLKQAVVIPEQQQQQLPIPS